MKPLLLLLLLLLTACSPKLAPTIAPAPSHDTLIAHHHTLDSVRITTDTRYRFGLTKCEPTPPWREDRVSRRRCFPAEGTAGSEGRAWGEGRRETAIKRPTPVINRPTPPQRVDTLVTTQVVERYRIRHDTIRVVRCDSIPYAVEVPIEVAKPIPKVYRYALWFVILFVLYWLVRLAIRLYLRR